jgi:hypothetical protein
VGEGRNTLILSYFEVGLSYFEISILDLFGLEIAQPDCTFLAGLIALEAENAI